MVNGLLLRCPQTIKLCARWLIIFAFCLLVLELSLRKFLGLGNPPLLISHPTIEYLFKPNQEVYRFGNKIIYNSYSMRNELVPDDLIKKILVTGDSVVNGGSLTDQNDLATDILENHLNRTKNSKYFVGNISAGSWGPKNNVEYFKEYGYFGAEALIYVVSSHDLYDVPEYKSLDRHILPQEGYSFAIQELLEKYIFKRLISELKNFTSDEDENFTQHRYDTLPEIRGLINEAKEKVRKVCLILHPTKNELIADTLDDYGKLQSSIATLANISVFDGRDYLLPSYYRDNIHLNKSGQTALAFEILKCLEL